jgi:hypothetical protein
MTIVNGTSQGGATTMLPALIALRPACDRAAQSSSAIASGVAVTSGKERRTCANAWSRDAALRKKIRQPSGALSSMASTSKSSRSACSSSAAESLRPATAAQARCGAVRRT